MTSRVHAERPTRVLVADDEHLVALEISALLADAGYTIVGPAADGQRAIDLCRVAAPEVVLMDVKMPGLGGLEAAKVVFTELGIPVVMLTAHATTEDLEQARDAGVFGYIIKPASAQQLRAAIEVAWKKFLEHTALTEKAADLNQKLQDRRVIEQAKWIIVKSKRVSEPDALRLLQDRARNTRKPMIEIARGIVESADLMGNS